jgi:hypothetical protein
MNAAILYLAAAAVGINAGWRPLPDGGMEYIIQLEPEALDLLRSGQAMQSDIPAQVQNVRGYRIIVGSGAPPRIDAPAAAMETEKPALGPLLLNAAGQPLGPAAPGGEGVAPDIRQADGTRRVPSTLNSEPAKPWLPLTLTSLLCFASLAAFVYLLWIHLELRGRYRKLLQSSLEKTAMALNP